MRAIRRLFQVAAVIGTLMVGGMSLALIVSQTPWFRDWLRRYIVRESKQYLNGELTIGSLGGNLLYGVSLANVTVDVSGERVVAVKSVAVDYSVFQLISSGIVVDGIAIDQPALHLVRDANGWNLARLVKRQAQEADRHGPRRPVSLPRIAISDATVSIDDRGGPAGVTLPRRIEDLDVRAAFEYAPVHYTVTLDHISFRGTSPDVSVQQLAGRIALRGDNLYLDRIALATAETSVTVDGAVEQYLTNPVLNLTTTGIVSLPEAARMVPAVAGYALHPRVRLKMNGPVDRLAVEMDVRSEAGAARGTVVVDGQAPDLAVKGDVRVERLNLAPILKDPAQRTDLTGQTSVDLRLRSQSSPATAMDRISGRFTFKGPTVVAAGYEAHDVSVSGTLDGPRITFDGRAAAYGGTATARGLIVTPAEGRGWSFDLRGSGHGVDLRKLPAVTGAPDLATSLAVAEYHVRGDRGSISGTVTLDESTVEGATFADGTSGEFTVTPTTIAYAARGTVAGLDLDRIGQVLRVEALNEPAYDSRINGRFDVTGSQPRTPSVRRGTAPAPVLSTMTLDASGSLSDSHIMGGRLPALGFEAHLDRGALTGRADGGFEGFNPAQISGRKALDGSVDGTVNASFSISDITAPITSASITADGTATLGPSSVGGVSIDRAVVEGSYASEIAHITSLTLTGPDLAAEVSGRLALGREATSALTYHVEAINLPKLASLAGYREVAGTAILDGTIAGNAGSLTATGTLNGGNLGYGETRALDVNSRYTATVPDLTLARVHVQATTEATFVAVGGMQLNGVTATTTYDQQRLAFSTSIKEATREVDATGELVLHPDHQEIHLPQLALRTQGIEWHTAPGSTPTIRYGRGRIELQDVALVSGDQSVRLEGRLALTGEVPAGVIDVQARNVDIHQLETLALQNRGLTGRMTADARVSGTIGAPIVDGRVRIDNGGVETYHYDSLTAQIGYGGTHVTLDATLQQSPSEAITAKGSVPTTIFKASADDAHVEPAAGDAIDVQVTSTAVGLGFVQGFTTVVANVTGTLEANVHVGGSGRDPHIKGYVDIKGGGFSVPAVGGSFTGLTTRIDLEPERVRIQRFELLDHHAEKLTVAGELAVHARQVGAVDVSIDSDNFEVLDNELGDIQVQAALKVTGELRRPRVVGTLRLDAARVEVDTLLQLFYNPYGVSSLPDIEAAERTVEVSGSAEEATRTALTRAEQAAAAPGAYARAARIEATAAAATGGLFEGVALDVQLVIPGNLVLRGKDLRPGGPTGAALGNMNITVGGDVRILKHAGAAITPIGTVNTVRGTYEFQGRRFDLARNGTIRFIGTAALNPILDISATRGIPNTGVIATVRVTGTPASPRLALSSDPPLEESDILALIVFNRPVNELGTGERSSLAASAGGIATGFIAAPLGDSIGRALDLDLFEISTTTDAGELGAGVTVGQQLGERAFVKLRQQFGARNITEFMLEYQLADVLRLQASGAPETSGSANRVNQRRVERAGIDLIFLFSY